LSRILITGANGFIGQYITRELVNNSRHQVIATGKTDSRLPFIVSDCYQYLDLDITDRSRVDKIFETEKPEVVIHTAALGQPDFCEQNRETCFAVNVTGTKNIAESCKKINSFLVFLSTDFVFDGESGPYRETDKVNPINIYGKSKLQGEQLIHETSTDHAVVRLCSVYGIPLSGDARNIITWVQENLVKMKSIKAVDDQVRTPTYIGDATDAIITLADKKISGIFHISGEQALTPYDMAMATASYLRLDQQLIEKVNSALLNQPARRPLVTGFVIDKAKNTFGFNPRNFSEGLQEIFS
jgi:dTDP-4-dehydrorhamnose reductase